MTRTEYHTTKEVSKGLFISVTMEDIEEVLTFHDRMNENNFFETLWFEVGSYVKVKDNAEIWQIVTFEKTDNKIGINYIVKINFLNGEKKINLFSVPYEEIFGQSKNEKQELKKILSKINLDLVDTEDAEMIIELQEAIREMENKELFDFLESGEIAETELPYIEEFLIEEADRRKNIN